jgi:hypothetical protein
MATDASLLRLTADRGVAAAFVFSWEDEWFKRTWNTTEHQDAERRQLWHDPLTNEQYFGLMATDPGRIPDAAAEATPTDGAVEYAYVWADHSWVHVEVTGRDGVPAKLGVDADVLPGPDVADYRVAVDRGAGTATAQVRQALDPIRLDTSSRPYRPDEAEPWHVFWLLTNRARAGHPAEYDRVGELVEGSWDPRDPHFDSMATWQVDEAHDTVRLRIPWSMLGLADPSQKLALGPGTPAPMVKIPGIAFDVTVDGDTQRLRLDWPEWTRVTYTVRPKAGTDVLERALRDLAP